MFQCLSGNGSIVFPYTNLAEMRGSFFGSTTKILIVPLARKKNKTMSTTTTESTTPATKTRKQRDPEAEPLPLVIAVESIKVPSALAEKARKRFSLELRNTLKKAYATYEEECTKNNEVPQSFEDWKKEEGKAISLRDFTKAFVAKLMSPVIDSVMTFAEEAQEMTFSSPKKARVKIDQVRVNALCNALVAEIIAAGAKSLGVGLEKAIEDAKQKIVDSLPAYDLPENTDFSGVKTAVAAMLATYGKLPFDAVGIAEHVLQVLPADDENGEENGDDENGDDDENADENADENETPAENSSDDEGTWD